MFFYGVKTDQKYSSEHCKSIFMYYLIETIVLSVVPDSLKNIDDI